MLSRMTVGASSSPLPALGVPANVSIVSLLHARRSAAPHSSSSCEAVAYEPLWTTFLTSRCSAIGVMVSSTSHADSTDTNALCGVAALGFMDGSIQFLSLQSGLRLAPALSLGAPVVSLSCLSSDQQNYRHRCLAVCADGECYVWTVTSSGTMMAAMGRQAHTSPDDAVKLLFKTSIRPTISSLRSIHAEGASSSLSTAQGGSDGEASFLVEDVYIAPRTLRPVPSGQQQLEPFTGSDGGVALFVSIACLVASSLSTTAAATSSVSCSDGLLEERAVFEYLPGPGAWSQVPHTHRFLERYLYTCASYSLH
jgi:WD40 repeat protein